MTFNEREDEQWELPWILYYFAVTVDLILRWPHGEKRVRAVSLATTDSRLFCLCFAVNSSSSRPLSGDSLPFHPQFSRPLQATLQLYGANGLHSSLPTFSASQAMSLSTTVTSSYPASLPSPTESLVSSPVFQRSFSTGSLNWGAQGQYHAMSVRDWLKSLRLHKYSQLSKRETFDEVGACETISNDSKLLVYVCVTLRLLVLRRVDSSCGVHQPDQLLVGNPT